MNRTEEMNRNSEGRLRDELVRGEKRISDQIRDFGGSLSDRVDRVERMFSRPN